MQHAIYGGKGEIKDNRVAYMLLKQSRMYASKLAECRNVSWFIVLTSIFKIMFFIFIPVFSYMHLKKYYKWLEDKQFQVKFNVLY